MRLPAQMSLMGLSELAGAARSAFFSKDAAAVAQRAGAVALAIRLGNAALAYVAQVVLARLMGQFEYGVFAYTWVGFLVFGGMATLGFADSPVRFIPYFREHDQADRIRGFIRFAPLAVIVGSTLVGALLIAALSFAGPAIGAAYVQPMVLMAIALPFACLQGYLEGVGRSYGWMTPALLPVYILRHGLLLAFMLLAVGLGLSADAVTAFGCVILTLVVSLVYQAVAITRRLRGVLQPGPRVYKPLEWLRGSAPFSVFYGAGHLSSFADVFVLSFFVSPAEIAIYFAATRVIQIVNLIPFAATMGAGHLISATHARGDRVALQRLCQHVARLTFLIAAATVLAVLAAGDMLLGMFGDGFEAGYIPLAILAVGLMARVTAGPAEDILNMTGYGTLAASTYLVIVGINIALNVALIIPFGVNGAAIATSCALALRAVWLSLAVRRKHGIRTWIFAGPPSWVSLQSSSEINFPEARQPAE